MTTKPEPLDVWVTISDSAVRHIWMPKGSSDPDDEVAVSPDFYEQNGTPVDGEAGDDMVYIRTEVKHVR